MDAQESENKNIWTEDVSREFIDFGSIFIPNREYQMDVIVSLLATFTKNASILELCCGEGLLAEKILETYPGARFRALDGSQEMLERTIQRLARFENRVEVGSFDLASRSWRSPRAQYDGVVSSLAIHHLPGLEKLALFNDVFQILSPGVFLSSPTCWK